MLFYFAYFTAMHETDFSRKALKNAQKKEEKKSETFSNAECVFNFFAG